jgi:dolichol-phosphate mannosyltransferase
MARVCLILPIAAGADVSDEFVTCCRSCLEGAGHAVVVLAVHETGSAPARESDWGVVAGGRGLASAAMAGLVEAAAVAPDAIVILDPFQGYRPEGLPDLIAPLEAGEAELAVARREPSPRRVFGARRLLGASDVFAGLVALTPELANAVTHSFEPVGSRFAIDLLVRCRGRRVEVAVAADGPPSRPRLSFDDLRHLKRLADDRFGNASRLIQFCAVGASGMVVDLTCYAVFQLVFSRTPLSALKAPLVGGPLDLAVAGALAILVALTWNFSLNRRLTFNYARAGSIVRQYLTYAASNALGVALSFSLRLFLPENFAFFHRHKLVAAVVGIVAATGISFSMSRWVVFSRRSVARDRARAESRATAASS